jgi:hypothetical protein
LVSPIAEAPNGNKTTHNKVKGRFGLNPLFTSYRPDRSLFHAAKLDRRKFRQTRTKTVSIERTFIGHTGVELSAGKERGTTESHPSLFVIVDRSREVTAIQKACVVPRGLNA